MKTFAAAAISFFVILGGLFVYVAFMDSITGELVSSVDKVCESVKIKDWGKSNEEFGAFYILWEKKRKLLGIFVEQSKADAVSENIHSLRAYIENESYPEAMARLKVVRLLISQLNDNEKPNMVNILKTVT